VQAAERLRLFLGQSVGKGVFSSWVLKTIYERLCGDYAS